MRFLLRLIGLVVLLVVVAVAGLLLLPKDRMAQVAATQISNALGRDVTLSGGVSLTFWPVFGASVGGLEIANAEWSDMGPMLSTQDAAFGLDAAALLSGDIRVTHVDVTAPRIAVERRADGRASWVFGPAPDAAATPEASATGTDLNLSLDRVSITDASLLFVDEGAAPVEVDGLDLALSWPADTDAVKVTASLAGPSGPVSLDAVVEQVTAFLDGAVQPVRAVVTAGSGEVQFDGRADIAGDVAGAVVVNLPDTAAFLAALSVPGQSLPAGLGQSLALTTDLTVTGQKDIALRGLTADLGRGNTISGDVDVALSEVPNVRANLTAGALDLTALTASSGSGGGDAAAAGWPKDPIDASALALFEGEGVFRAESIDLGDYKFGTTDIGFRNERSRLVLDLRQVAMFGGSLGGEFVVNNRSGLSVGGALQVSSLSLNTLLTEMADVTNIDGQTSVQVSFLGVGNTLDQIMNSLSGQGGVQITRGRFEGYNLDELLRTGKFQGGTTVFNDLAATFTMEQGQLYNSDLYAVLQDFEARGEGRVGLGPQDIDYTLTPVALEVNESQGGLEIPVRITGPWSSPKVTPDLEAALKLNLQAEKEELERKLKEEAAAKEAEIKAKLAAEEAAAKSKLQQQVEQSLGVQTQPGQSVGQALQDKVKDDVQNGLRKLFD